MTKVAGRHSASRRGDNKNALARSRGESISRGTTHIDHSGGRVVQTLRPPTMRWEEERSDGRVAAIHSLGHATVAHRRMIPPRGNGRAPVTFPPPRARAKGLGDSSGLIFRSGAPSGRTDPGLSAGAPRAYLFRQRFCSARSTSRCAPRPQPEAQASRLVSASGTMAQTGNVCQAHQGDGIPAPVRPLEVD